jgi:hypothetical protein
MAELGLNAMDSDGFPSTKILEWETRLATGALSLCFSDIFFAKIASEDLDYCPIFRPRR